MLNDIGNHTALQSLKNSLEGEVIGQEHVVNALLIALLADTHILLEGLPGTAKTRSVRSLASSIDVELNRVQFTPDLMPTDVIGYESISEGSTLSFVQGPVFTNILLADEINRAPPKVQSALLEAMEERQVTVSGKMYPLPDIFMVLATQNPVEQEGTYPLPEAQLDRFLMKVSVDYPDRDQELKVLRLVKGEQITKKILEKVSPEFIKNAREEVKTLYTSESIEQYIVDLIIATRTPALVIDDHQNLSKSISFGASPRATLALDKAARAHAYIEGRDFVSPEDVKAVLHQVLGHRIKLSFDALSRGLTVKDIIDEINQKVLLG
ncbi:MoxR family ATPase [Vibrio sp. SS-MA-C1-2]|uniref:AAA family ATPase n=1 Tax=Vibrio sp. SS-MA-C1-2 TaxID=2908646 RepID=UPI001F434547|nr:MoxR family ATPase [Vibrio sp. SS-MA-C1-2]UJF18064.1 MoxR family ATPase [Vibrio sp. SS-MA-C1-2]